MKPAVLAIAVVLTLCALPSLAAQTPPAASVGAAAGAATSTGAIAPAAFMRDLAPRPAAAAAVPEWLQPARKFHGFCRCGCSPIPDCNTDADCGGGVCSSAISCC